MLPFHEPVRADFEAVDALIIRELRSDVGMVESIGHYLVEAGGKRLRPLLVLLAARALGYRDAQHLKLAAIVEFIHSATLLHDDVVDLSERRRGRATANAKWGNAPSVLVGDFLYSRAFQLMVEIGQMRIMHILADTTNTISEGEVEQLANARNPAISEASYFHVIYKKTAVLFASAGECAGVLAGASEPQQKALQQYGYHVGAAFQLVDDLLDYSGDGGDMGKNVGDDLAEGKPTLPLIVAMREAPEADARTVAEALRQGSTDELERVLRIVKEAGGLNHTRTRAREHVAQARACLLEVPDGPYRRALEAMADFALSRDF